MGMTVISFNQTYRGTDGGTMKVTTEQYAGPHTTFAPDAFDSQIGRTVPLTLDGETIDTATLTEAQVSEDGAYVEFTFDVPDRFLTSDLTGISLDLGDAR